MQNHKNSAEEILKDLNKSRTILCSKITIVLKCQFYIWGGRSWVLASWGRGWAGRWDHVTSLFKVSEAALHPQPPGESQNPYSNRKALSDRPHFTCLNTSPTVPLLLSTQTALPSSSFSGWQDPLSSLRCHHSVRPVPSGPCSLPGFIFLSPWDLLTCYVVD